MACYFFGAAIDCWMAPISESFAAALAFLPRGSGDDDRGDDELPPPCVRTRAAPEPW